MTDYFRVTVEDLATGHKQAVEIAEGDYILIPTGSCYLDGASRDLVSRTVTLTIRGHDPSGPKRQVTP